MHESGLVRDLVRRLEQAARDAGATRVSAADIWLGALSHFSEPHFREHFDDAARGSLAAGATLRITLSDDATDPHAQDVMLHSVELDVPDPEAPPG